MLTHGDVRRMLRRIRRRRLDLAESGAERWPRADGEPGIPSFHEHQLRNVYGRMIIKPLLQRRPIVVLCLSQTCESPGSTTRGSCIAAGSSTRRT